MSLESILGLDKKLVMKYKKVFLLLKMSFKIPLKIIYIIKNKGKSCWLNEGGLKKLLTMNPMEKQIKKMNTTSDNMTYLVDNKTICVSIKNCNR